MPFGKTNASLAKYARSYRVTLVAAQLLAVTLPSIAAQQTGEQTIDLSRLPVMSHRQYTLDPSLQRRTGSVSGPGSLAVPGAGRLVTPPLTVPSRLASQQTLTPVPAPRATGRGDISTLPAASYPGTNPGDPGVGLPQPARNLPPASSGQLPLSVPALATAEPRFQFNFSKAPWQVVLRQFAEQFGLSLHMSTDLTGQFTYFDARSYSISEAVDIFNDYLLQEGVILIRNGGNLSVVDTSRPVPDGLIRFIRTEELASVGRNELVTIALSLDHSEPVAAVQEISEFLSPVGRAQPLTNSRRIVVTDTGAYLRRIRDLVAGVGVASEQPRSLVYELRHADAEDVAKAINDFYQGQTGSDTQSAIVIPEKTTKSLIIRDHIGRGAEIYSLIQQLDRPPRQALISALIVEVQLGKTDEFGVELGFQDSVLFDRSVIDNILTITETATTAVGTQTTNERIISQTAAPGFNFNNQPLGNNVAINPSRVGSQALSSFGVGRVNGDLGFGGLVLSAGSENINVLLRALDSRFDVDILSRPQVRAIDNHEALIQIGQQVPVVDGVSVTATGSANPVIRQDQAGIILKVTPKISPEGRVLIDVQAEKSAFQLTPGTGVPIFTDATNGNVLEAPVKDITTANTLVSVSSGQTVVLGGMITNEEIIVERKVPFLGDIPGLGHLFRHDLHDNTRRELLIFLTPHVVESDCHSDELNEQMKAHVHLPAKAFEFEELGGGHSMIAPQCTPTANSLLPPARSLSPVEFAPPVSAPPVSASPAAPALRMPAGDSQAEPLGVPQSFGGRKP